MKLYLDRLEALYSDKTFQRKVDYIKYNFRNLFLNKKAKDLKVLEIGPGVGEFIYYLNEQNIKNIDIIDNDKSILEFINRKYKIKNAFLTDDISRLKNKLHKYDLIALVQVLEHIPVTLHNNLIRLLYNCLEQRGSLVIVVPNANNPLGLVERYGDIQHISSFTTQSLLDLAQNAGIDKNEIAVTGFEIPPFNIINILRIIIQKILHNILYLLLIMNGGIYYKPLTPNIMLKISK